MAQIQAHGAGGDEPEDDDAGLVAAPQAQTDAVDALLEDIDEALQSNAEQFVRSFVQTGGQ